MRIRAPHAPSEEAAYVFDRGNILPGDIILSTVPTDLLSRTIRAATKSDFSHAAICSKPGLLVEARGFGVARISMERLAVRDPSNVRVLRLRKQRSLGSAAIAAKAAAYAEKMVLSNYFYWGAAFALLRQIPVECRAEFFCSHLVAEAYRAATGARQQTIGRSPAC